MKNFIIKHIHFFILLFFLFAWLYPVQNLTAASATDSVKTEKTAKEFNPGEMIIDHVVDNHEWHILEWGETAVSVPLPVILLDNGTIHTFFSSRFHHGTVSYEGYKLETEGNNKGKIVKVLPGTMETDKAAAIPLDFSITKTVLAMFFSMILLMLLFISVANAYKRRPNQAPKKLQLWLEPVVLFIRDDIAIPSIGEKKYERFMPYLLTLFTFILMNNLMGLLPFFPGGANVTGNIAVTLVLAVFTFIITTVNGNKAYWKHIFNAPGVPWWLKFPIPLMPIVELVGVFTKPFVLMVRLFANISAGHIIILGFMSLIFIFGKMHWGLGLSVSVVSVAFTLFMSLLELLVAVIQAYVFTLLSALYFGMAMEEHHG